MRFMFDYYKSPSIEAIESIDATPCWENGAYEGNENNPTYFVVTMYKHGYYDITSEEEDWFEISGRYCLDGTEETYLKAVENYNKVCNMLLEKGYCRASDFENFEWY